MNCQHDSDRMELTVGQAIDAVLGMEDDEGQPVSLAGLTARICDSNSPVLKDHAEITVDDEYNFRLRLSREFSTRLRPDTRIWFRVEFLWPSPDDDVNRVTPPIWIDLT